MENSDYKKFLIKIILPLSIVIYMSYNIYVNISYIMYYKDVINKNKSIYFALINDKKHKEKNCSEIIEKISKEKNCTLSKVTKDDSENVLEINVSYIGNLAEINEFVLRISKEKSFQDLKYIHVYNNIPKSQSELHITFKI